MASVINPAGPQGGPGTALHDALMRLHRRTGYVSTRDVSRRTEAAGNRVSHTTVSYVLRGDALHEQRWIRWGTLAVIVEALGGDPEDFREMWQAGAEQPGPNRTRLAMMAAELRSYGFTVQEPEDWLRRPLGGVAQWGKLPKTDVTP